MKIKSNKTYAIVGVTIEDINNKEMCQMHELNLHIKDVLDSHKPESKEKKYISDDDLKLMHAILSVFTEEYSSTQNSAFDDFLTKQEKQTEKSVEEPKQQEEENETLIKGGPGGWPEEPIIGESKNF